MQNRQNHKNRAENRLLLPGGRIRSAALAADLPWRRIAASLACVIAAALIAGASVFGSVRPFALALLAAADGFAMSTAALAGSLIGASAFPAFPASAAASLVLFAARVLVGTWLCRGEEEDGWGFRPFLRRGASEPVRLRAVFASAAAMIGGAVSLLGQPITVRRVLVVFASALITPAATLAFCTLTDRDLARRGVRDAGVCLFLFAAVRALRDVTGIPFRPEVSAAFALALIAARGIRFGRHAAPLPDASRVMWGVLCGVVVGFAADPGGAPVYAAAALAAGILFPVSAGAAVAAGWLCAVGLSFAGGGLAALSAAVPELSVSAAILVPLFQFGILPAPPASVPLSESHSAAVTEAAIARESGEFSLGRMRSLSAAMASLGVTVGGLSRKLARPPLAQVKQIAESAFDAECASCANRIVCRERECASFGDMICRLSISLHREERADAAAVPPSLAARCHRLDEILAEAENVCAREARRARALDHSEAFAEEYQSFARLLADAAEESEAAFAPDEAMSARLKREMAAMEIGCSSVTVSGTRRRTVRAHDLDLSRLRLGNGEIRAAFEGVLGCPLSAPEYQIDGERVSLRMDSVPRFTLHEGICARTAGEMRGTRLPGGDCFAGFDCGDGRYYAVICDGMGTGSEASVTARTAAAFLEETLRGGAQMQTALMMLNGYLRRRSLECSAGIDLMEIDRYTGVAKFVKSGAAPSFVIRRGRLFRLCSKTVPIGILRALDAEMIRFELEKGDVIVMLSDGVSGDTEGAAWLCDMLAAPSAAADGAEELAEKIIRAACAGGGHRDDATAAVVKVG